MRRNIRRGRVHLRGAVAVIILAVGMIGLLAGQGGDQFLDGIGETALVARYLFNGNAEDSSRNHFHAALNGIGAAYVEDARFGRALELAGNGSYAQLPANALAGEDTISVTAWLYLPTGASGPFLDFGQSASSRLFATASAASGFSAGFAAGQARGVTESKAVPVNQWVHLAVVLDPANRLLTTYVDGVRAGQASNVGVNAAQLIGQGSADATPPSRHLETSPFEEWLARRIPALEPIEALAVDRLSLVSIQPEPLAITPLDVTPLGASPTVGDTDTGRQQYD